jgi:hypothetical protein
MDVLVGCYGYRGNSSEQLAGSGSPNPQPLPHRNPFGPNQVLVGMSPASDTVAEATRAGFGEPATPWCTGPPLNTYCTALEGPAVVPIPTPVSGADGPCLGHVVYQNGTSTKPFVVLASSWFDS